METTGSGDRLRRRGFVAAVGGATLGAVGSAAATDETGEATPKCDGTDTATDDRTPDAERQNEVAALRSETAALHDEIDRVREETRRERARFPESVRERARDVGLNARDGVVAIDFGVPGVVLPGWFLEEDRVVATAGLFRDENVPDVTAGTAWLPDGESAEWELETTIEFGPDLWGVAVLATDRSDRSLPIGDASGLSSGDRLVQVGHVPYFGNWIVALGEFQQRIDDPELLAGDVPVEQGIGGAPVLDADGDVVGMTVQTGPLRTGDLPAYLDRPVHHEHPRARFESRHLPVGRIRERVEGST